MSGQTNQKKSKTKERIFTVVFIFLVTLVFISLLAGVNALTKDRIDYNKKVRLIRLISYSANLISDEAIININNEVIDEKTGEPNLYDITIRNDENEIIQTIIKAVKSKNGNIEYYEVRYEKNIKVSPYDMNTKVDLNNIVYVFRTRGPGLWGEIVALIGFDETLETITGIEFVEQTETPGLGARISEEWFKSQFVGKDGPKKFINKDKYFTTVPEKEKSGPNEFSAVTGATITSNYVRSIINETIKKAQKIFMKNTDSNN